jgi:hypothetical protein
MRHMMERTVQSFLMSQLHNPSVDFWLADRSTVVMPEGLLDQFLGTRAGLIGPRDTSSCRPTQRPEVVAAA